MKGIISTFITISALGLSIPSAARQPQNHLEQKYAILTTYALRPNVSLVAVGLSALVPSPQCFNIHVRLNGARIDDPQLIVLKTKQLESAVHLEEGCFTVPPALITEKALDVYFTVSGSRIYLSAIDTGFFAGPWDIDLADKKFGNGVPVPKHAHAKEACAVVFHVGEPERALVQTPCRTPQ